MATLSASLFRSAKCFDVGMSNAHTGPTQYGGVEEPAAAPAAAAAVGVLAMLKQLQQLDALSLAVGRIIVAVAVAMLRLLPFLPPFLQKIKKKLPLLHQAKVGRFAMKTVSFYGSC